MRRTLLDLADARKELLEIQQEFGRLQKRIDAVRDCVTESLTRIFGEIRPAASGVVGTHAAETSPLDAPKKMSAKSAAPKSLSCEGLPIRAQSSTLTYFLCCTPLL